MQIRDKSSEYSKYMNVSFCKNKRIFCKIRQRSTKTKWVYRIVLIWQFHDNSSIFKISNSFQLTTIITFNKLLSTFWKQKKYKNTISLLKIIFLGNISAVFVTKSFGENLSRLIVSHPDLRVSISEGQRLVRQLTK